MDQSDIDMNLEYLDTIDLPIPMYKEEICEYMERADFMSNKRDFPKQLKNELFRFLSVDDVTAYLQKRFKIRIERDAYTVRVI